MNSQPVDRDSWPDWSGQTAIVVASGPSTKGTPLRDVRGRARVLAVKENVELVPWADVLYASDRQWWEERGGVPKFRRLKITASPLAAKMFPEIRQIRLASVPTMVVGEIGTVGCGSRYGNGHSGFHALNLAVQFGAKRIMLVGFDMTLDHGAHWHGRPRVAAPTASLVAEWREALDGCAAQFMSLGIDVVNASQVSALKNYPKVDLMDAVSG